MAYKEKHHSEAKGLVKQTDVTKDHWETIQQWRVDEGKNFARSRSSEITRMAASGMKKGTQQWDDNLATLDAANQKALKSQAGSATQGILDRWTEEMKGFYVNATKRVSRTYQTKGDDRTTTRDSTEMTALKKYGGGKNPYVDSGLSEEAFMALTTDQFMEASFGRSKGYSEFTDEDGSRAAAANAEGSRQQAAHTKTQRASPWWT